MKSILGTMTFGDQVDRSVAASMISAFRVAGYKELDSAYMYCAGATEKLLGELNEQGNLSGCELPLR